MRTGLTFSLLAAGMILFGCGKQEEKYEEVRPVWTITVGETSGSVGAAYSGEVRARYESKLAFRIGGKIAVRQVEVGTHVTANQSLMRLDPGDVAQNVIAATAQARAARSRVQQDRTDLERAEQLYRKNFISQAEYDQTRLTLETSESQLKSAEAQLQIAQNQQAYATLVADRAGVVTAINAEVGQVVAAGQTVLTLAADGEREVVISVPEARVDEIRGAKRMTVTLWADAARVYDASLRELAPDADSVTRTYAAKIAIREPDAALRLGMTATVQIPDVQGGSAIRLPLTAIYNKEGRPLVWIVDPKTSRVDTRPVEVAAAHNDIALVARGLANGEVVVTAGVHMLHPGQKVKPVAAGATGAAK